MQLGPKSEKNMRTGSAKRNTYMSFAPASQSGVSTKSQIKVTVKHPQQNVSAITREKWGCDIVVTWDVKKSLILKQP